MMNDKINDLNRYLLEQVKAGKFEKNKALDILKELNSRQQVSQKTDDIAIIGMACRFPEANNPREFWENLRNEANCVTTFPGHRRKYTDMFLPEGFDPKLAYLKAGYLREVDRFDHEFFSLTKREAMLMDPLQRLFLTTAWEAVEDAGYGGQKIYGTRTGVYVGKDHAIENSYKKMVTEPDPLAATGSWASILARRFSYIFNLRGPSIVMDTACSSGLLALHTAVQALRSKECEMAIIGGVNIFSFPLNDGGLGMIEAADGFLRPFDRNTQGTVWGEGLGAVMLKPMKKALADGDNIYAVIKGSAVNNDAASSGLTAPNPEAQEDVITRAWKEANVEPETIRYIECHGTGTELGDPIEIKGITNAFRKHTDRRQFCGIGTAKANLGHMVAASGIGSLIKVVLALKHREIPGTLNFADPNQYINFHDSPIYVVDKLQELKTEEIPLRAGVSAFGFSGTNCHVVLEERPGYEKQDVIAEHPYILTLSARNFTSLKELLWRYTAYLDQDVNLANLCYTANTGRGHYNYRLILIISDLIDLKDKLGIVIQALYSGSQDLRKFSGEGIYYGEYQIIAANKKNDVNGITGREIRQLSKAAADLVSQLDSEYGTVLEEMCQLYILGADLPWDEIYRDQKIRRVSLPTYPYNGKRLWVKVNPAVIHTHTGRYTAHPLLERCVIESVDQDIFQTNYKNDKQWVLREHRLLGQSILPETAYLEMVLQACSTYYPRTAMRFVDVRFEIPLVVGDGEMREVQTVIVKNKSDLEFKIISKESSSQASLDENWMTHASGRLVGNPITDSTILDIEEIWQRLKAVTTRDNQWTESYELGPRWKNLQHVRKNEREILVRLELAAHLITDLETYHLHPGLLETALVQAVQYGEEGLYLPESLAEFQSFASLPEKFYAYLIKVSESPLKVVYDVWLLEASGRILAEVTGLTLQKVTDLELAFKMSGERETYYQPGWELEELTQEAEKWTEGDLLVFKDSRGIADNLIERLNQLGKLVIQVEIGAEYAQLNQEKFLIRETEEDYRRLFAELKGRKLGQIIHLQSMIESEDNDELTGQLAKGLTDLSSILDHGVMSLFYLSRAIVHNRIKDNLEIVLVADRVHEVTGREQIIQPAAASLFGLGKVVSQEMAELNCRCLDIDGETGIDLLCKELQTTGREYLVAYRQGQRYREKFVQLKAREMTPDVTGNLPVFRQGGVYLITGGTGGIGLEICHYLASSAVGADLALLNRSTFPGREVWETILAQKPDSRLAMKISKIQEIEARGVKIHFYTGDVTSSTDLERVIAELKTTFGGINGIIHAAGLAGDGLLTLRKEAIFREVLAPKIHGTWLLDRLTMDEQLDFFVMFSSIASLLGGKGQGDYTAANAYLDAYAQYLNKRGRRAIAINWPAWKETGMAVDYGVNDEQLVFKSLSTLKALRSFDRVIHSQLVTVIPGELNYQLLAAIEGEFPLKLPPEISRKIRRVKLKIQPSAAVKTDDQRVLSPDATLEEIEELLAEIWAEVFGVEHVERDDNFYDLGGHSLNATLLAARVKKAFGVEITLEDIFNCPTVKELASLISGAEESIYDSIEAVEELEYYQVSSAQKRMFVLYKLDGGTSIHYNMPAVLIVEGELDREHFIWSINELIARHESLRTSFHVVEGEVVQRVHQHLPINLEYQEADEEDLTEFIRKFIRPFDLSVAPLLRVNLVKIRTDDRNSKHLFLFDMHHIISDGYSISILVKDFVALYDRRELPELKIQYRDFAHWQNKLFESQLAREQEKYWLETFSGELPLLNLPTDYPRPAIMVFGGDVYRFSLSKSHTIELNNLAAKKGATLYMVMLAIYNVLLAKYTGQEDIIVGTPIAGRPHADLEHLIGMFVNTLAMRNYPQGELSFDQFLGVVKERALRAYENQDYQFEMLVDQLNLKRDMSRNPLFDTMLALQNTPTSNFDIPGLTFRLQEFEYNVAKFDLTLTATEMSQGINFVMEYSTQLFKRKTIQAMAGHFLNLIKDIISYPEKPLAHLNIFSPEERELVMVRFNDNRADFSRDRSVYQLIEERAADNPEKFALVYEGVEMTYGVLNARANQLARVLKKSGLESDQTVGILLERSPLLVEGILAVWKAGGAYIPIDIEYPGQRISRILQDSTTNILLTLAKYQDGDLGFPGETILLDDRDGEIRKEDESNLDLPLEMNNLAYVIYTSGSTGRPKGAMVEHIGMMNHLQAKINDLQLDQDSIIAQNSSHCFDISVWQFFAALNLGGKTVIYSNELSLDPGQLISQVIIDKVTILEVVPSLLGVILDYLEVDCREFADLEYLLVTGETVKPNLVKRWFELYPNIKLVNAYGPTEASDDITHYVMDRASELESIPIGKPIQNFNIYIVDKYLQPCPVGVKGEICAAGIGVGRGYLNDPERTREVFLADPFARKETVRMYKTGDLGRWLADGNIEFFGRKDYQVKIRGFRIEMGEIESCLVNHPQIKEAVVIDYEDMNGNKYLCAYLIGLAELDLQVLRQYLKEALPEYMVPAYFVQLEKMPLNANGKIDRSALPEPESNLVTSTEYVPPENPVEEKLVELGKEILGVSQIGIDDNFFELGGHSLKAITLVSRIYKEFNVEIPLREIFKTPTISELAEYIQIAEKSLYTGIPIVSQQEFYPVSSAQKRMFVLNQLNPESTNYNLPAAIFVKGDLNLDKFTIACQRLIQRHEAFRTSFEFIDGIPVQKVQQEVEFVLEQMTLADLNLAQAVDEDQVVLQMVKDFVRPFDLTQAPLLRVGLCTLGDRYLLMMDVHHIISDAISMGLMIREVLQLYQGIDLPELRIQYKDFAVWQNRLLESGEIEELERYWLETFADEISVVNLPTDYPRPLVRRFEGDGVRVVIEQELARKVTELAVKEGGTNFMILLAAYNILLAKYSGQDDIIVGAPIAGRPHSDLENIMGMFVNTLALRNRPKREKTILQLIREVKDRALKAFEYQGYQFDMLVEKLDLERDLSRNPLFDTAFAMHNFDSGKQGIVIDDLEFVPYSFKNKMVKFDLLVNAVEAKTEIYLDVEYSSSLYKKSTIVRMFDHYRNILELMVDNPELQISELEMLSGEERNRLLEGFNDTKREFPKTKTLQQIFEEQVQITPGEIAVYFADDTMTYRELDLRANQLARLLREKGVQPDYPVAIMVERSLEMLVGIMAILKAGGAYLPIDPNYPEERISFILEDSNSELLLIQERYLEQIEFAGEMINLEDPEIYTKEGVGIGRTAGPENLAYIIYTSGSTGRPKGVMIEHCSVINRLNWMQNRYQLTNEDIILQKTPFTFDVSVWELFWWFLVGARVCFLKPEGEKEPETLLNSIQRYGITTIHFVPSMLQIFLEYLENLTDLKRLATLKRVFVSGEALFSQQIKRFNQLLYATNGTTLHNLYGPTEATVDITYFDCPVDYYQEMVPIGKPIDNVQIYILDRDNHLQPVGVPGELCVAGVGVARGYLNRPELSGEKFVEDPFIPGRKMYRTGDLAKWLDDGNIEFLGRLDYQVKVRGFRIEIGEIEARLLSHEKIREVVVAARDIQDYHRELCAYIIPIQDISVPELRAYLAEKLPEYMIPAHFVKLEKMPLTANGKVNRRALPDPDNSVSRGVEYAAATNEVEANLIDIWTEVLQVEQIGVRDNIFHLGGDSLKALRIVAKAGGQFTLADMYQHPTIESLAKYLRENDSVKRGVLYQLTIPAEDKRVSIVCIPYGGGNPIVYQPLASALSQLSNEYAIYSISLPGHDFGFEQELKPLNEIAEESAREILQQIKTPLVLYGHCVGSGLTLEIARRLEEKGQEIRTIYLGGILPVKKRLFKKIETDPWEKYSDREIYDFLKRLGAFSGELSQTEMAFIIQSFRHDVRESMEYFVNHLEMQHLSKLHAPIYSIIGDKDPLTKSYDKHYQDWSRYSELVRLGVVTGGGHYFVQYQADQVAQIIHQTEKSSIK